MTGHQQLVNDVKFSPDARLIASASFDKSVRLWNGTNGQFMARLLGMLLKIMIAKKAHSKESSSTTTIRSNRSII